MKSIRIFPSHFIFPLLFFFVGSLWVFASPISSSADDDFHLTSIWCSTGKATYCLKQISDEVLVPSFLNAGKIPKNFTGLPPCYVTWPLYDKSAKCLLSVEEKLVPTPRFNVNLNSSVFYKIHSFFVTDDVSKSVYLMRLMNVFLASLVLFVNLIFLDFRWGKNLILAWLVTFSPVAFFFVASTNPSSWAIIGIGSFWPSFMNFLEKYFNERIVYYRLLFLSLASAFISIAGRVDSLIYLLILSFASFIFMSRKINVKKKSVLNTFIATSIFFIIGLSIFNIFIRDRLNRGFMSVPKSSILENRPNAIINFIIELPSFFQGILGGQAPFWVQPNNLGRNFTYGVGWLEFSLPSATGILFFAAWASVAVFGFRYTSWRKNVAVIFLIMSLVLSMIFDRMSYGFLEGSYFQPRYFAPVMIAILGMIISNNSQTNLKFNSSQLFILGLVLYSASVLAIVRVISRYTHSPLVPYTNTGTPIEWSVFQDQNFYHLYYNSVLLFYGGWYLLGFTLYRFKNKSLKLTEVNNQ